MKISIQMNVFSGRADPVWSISQAQFKQLLALEVIEFDALNGGDRGLGYRGFTIRPSDKRGLEMLREKFGANAIHHKTGTFLPFQPAIEEFLIKTGRKFISNRVFDSAMVNLSRLPVTAARPQGRCPQSGATNPDYEPDFWNTDPGITWSNLCYNYANDQQTNSGAQPGRASGAAVNNIDCSSVSIASALDGLIPLGNLGKGSFQNWTLRDPTKEWLVALAINPVPGQEDFHFWRQDNNGCWSHKPGTSIASSGDNSGNRIDDPKTCDRGPYIEFCQYFVTHRNNVIIS